MEHSIAQFVLTLFTVLGYGGIAVAMAIESCCIPLPSELIMPLAGFLAFQQRFNLWGVALAGAVGCVIGSLVAYGIGSVGGRPLLLRYGRYVLISPHDADRADAFFARYGTPAIFLARLLPIVRTFISLPAGIARMHRGTFVVYTFLGSLPWCLALAFAGYVLGAHWQDVGGVLHRFDLLIAAALVALLALFVYRHVRHPAPGARAADRRTSGAEAGRPR
jgi:membrane protein DedA with SNARE-associated domain